jgi:chromosome condensin MukBEF ATPase and DNA-binding subunit MukB
MTDEELEKLLERREARLRAELESQERERGYERTRKINQLQTRIYMGACVGLVWLTATVAISTCTAQSEAERQTDALKERLRALEQRK